MPILNFDNKNVVFPDYSYADKYWPILTSLVFEEIADEEIKIPNKVESLLKKCFEKFCSIFNQKIIEQNKASFYIFCQYLHEDSIELWKKQTDGFSFGNSEEDFAASRRGLKIILEQSCKLNLIGNSNFFLEIRSNIYDFTAYLEELLYLNTWSFILSEFVSRSQLFPGSIGINIADNKLNILTYQPYPELYKFLFHEMNSHNSDIALSDSIIGFSQILKDKYQVDFGILSSFVAQQLQQKKYRFGLIRMDDIINNIQVQFKFDKEFLTVFYNGLTINKLNSLSVEECILKNQHENRHVFRPILELTVDDQIYHMIGYNKWIESITLLATNCFPFGQFPVEWSIYEGINDFVKEIKNTHDKLLENPIIEILRKKEKVFDSNIVSFKQPKNHININNSIGDIDILFIDDKYKIIYVCECKHNRSRFDLNNWKRDYSNFKTTYENQLERKVNWVNQNKEIIEHHLKILYSEKFNSNLTEFAVLGIFIINAPTVYMLNGRYRAFTISDFKDLMEEQYTDIKFELTIEGTGKHYFIEHPYFDNIEKALNI